jgi:hypothetical protein
VRKSNGFVNDKYYFKEIDFKVLGLTFRNQDATANMATIYTPRAS